MHMSFLATLPHSTTQCFQMAKSCVIVWPFKSEVEPTVFIAKVTYHGWRAIMKAFPCPQLPLCHQNTFKKRKNISGCQRVPVSKAACSSWRMGSHNLLRSYLGFCLCFLLILFFWDMVFPCGLGRLWTLSTTCLLHPLKSLLLLLLLYLFVCLI